MENIDKNADVLAILDSLQDYAAEYEERKKKQEEEEKRKDAEAERARADAQKKQDIQAQIAEMLGKIKTQEAADAKRWDEERLAKEAKKKKEEEMKIKIAAELAEMQRLEEEMQAKIVKEQQRRADEKLARLMKEAEEQRKKEEWEAKRLAEKKRIAEENIMKARVAAELNKLKDEEGVQLKQILEKQQRRDNPDLHRRVEEREEQSKREEMSNISSQRYEKKKVQDAAAAALREEQAARKAKDEELRLKRIEEEEIKRQSEIEEEKRKLLAIEQAKEALRVEEETKRRKEEDQRVREEILARRQAEEEENKQRKKEEDEMRFQAIEDANKKALENKKKAFERKQIDDKPPEVYERPKRKSIKNPFAAKFEEIAANAENEEKLQRDIMRKKKKDMRKSRDVLRRSRQILCRASKECIKKSQNMFKSNDSLKGDNHLQKSFSNLRRSLSKEAIGRSKPHLYDKERNLSSKNLSQEKTGEMSSVSKQKMQNYLVSQVLFDGKEDVKTSRMHLQNRSHAIQEEDSKAHRLEAQLREAERQEAETAEAKRIEDENKRKELAMIERENEVKRQIQEELDHERRVAEEKRIKLEEAQFESYKKEMEKYLDFVCEDDTSKPCNTKKKVIKKTTEEPSKKLKLNIGSIKNQFEEGEVSLKKETPPTKSATPVVRKLNTNNMFFDKKEDEQMAERKAERRNSKKDYVPVIIDKAAFERTMGMFEKEKKEAEENEIRIKKRRSAMEEEKKRLQLEKERHIAEEEERQREWEEEERQRIIFEKAALKIKEKEDANSVPEPEPEPKKPDIFEQIRLTLSQIKEDEESQRIKIEKERKKKELQDQIQQEIAKINTVDHSLKEKDEENVPAWVKLVMGDKKKNETIPSKVVPTKTDKKEAKTVDRTVIKVQETEDIDDVFAPKWITMFQERNKKLQAQKERDEEEEKERKKKRKALLKKSTDDEERKESTDDEADYTHKTLQKSKALGSLPVNMLEPRKKKSVADVKGLFESHNKHEKVELEKRSGKQKVADKVKKVKSMLLESGKSEKEVVEKKVTKQKAQKMKSMFETKDIPDTADTLEPPKRPKKKLVKVADIDTQNKQKHPNKEEQVWKWKEKSVSELYEFINHNRKQLPQKLAAKADLTFSNESTEKDILVEDEENFDKYIEDVQNYINQEDQNETESVFKDTIVAYLDLIDENPRKKQVNKIKEKKIFSVNTATMKGLIEGNKNNVPEKKDMVVGKIDNSFLFKEQEPARSSESNSNVSNLNTQAIKSKYEELGMTEEPKELYSMKRKLKLVAPAKDSPTPTKKEQVQYQWKYKQKGITELHKFIKENQEKVTKDLNKKTSASVYVPTLNFAEIQNRVQDEDRKMEEFERFMEDMHGYLEMDTKDDDESAFKWGIHSYLDLIEEDNDKKPSMKYEKKQKSFLPENVPKTMEIKARLHEQSKRTIGEKVDVEVGKVDLSFLSNSEKEEYYNRASIDVPSDVTLKMRAQFEEKDEIAEDQERVVVRRKIIHMDSMEEAPEVRREVQNQQWKYKQKSLAELQQFITKNKDIAPKSLVAANNTTTRIDTRELLAKSSLLRDNICDKEGEFNEFMDELEAFMGKTSNSKEETDVKEGIQGYLNLIDPEAGQDKAALPSLGSVRRISDIKSSLTSGANTEVKETNKLIGKVSHFFKKSTNEKVDSSVIRDNIANLLQPGKAKTLGKSFEKQSKLTRATSALDLGPSKKLNIDQFFKPKVESVEAIPNPKKQSWSYKEPKPPKLEHKIAEMMAKKAPAPSQYKNEWDDIEDPIEKQNAILAKYGLKPVKTKTEEEEDEELEDILNYECTDEMSR